MYGAEDHVDRFYEPLEQDIAWRRADVTVLLWIYGFIFDDLYDDIKSPDNTAFRAWNQLNSYDNQPGRLIHLDVEFRNTTQGDLRIDEYIHPAQGPGRRPR